MRPGLRPVQTGLIAVDIDGTLLIRGLLNDRAVAWCRERKGEGKKLLLWSARGEEYARAFAEDHGLEDLFDLIIGKPEATLDDVGWSWTNFTRIIKP